MTISGAAAKVGETQRLAELGRKMVEEDKFKQRATPMLEEAKWQGAQELASRIQAQREAATQAQMRQAQPAGLAGYLQTQEGII